MANNRIYYACQGIAISDIGIDPVAADLVHGAQSVGMTTTFNLEQAFELGQLEIYENIENVPDVEITIEKVLDGYPLLWNLCTVGAATTALSDKSKQRCDVRLGIFEETLDSISESNLPPTVEVYCSGMYVSNLSYTLPVDGNSTESITLVGNNKLWLTANQKLTAVVVDSINGNDSPPALIGGDGGIQRREDVMLSLSTLPESIPGVTGGGAGNGWNSVDNVPTVHIQNISISTDFNREDIFELGRKTPYYRPAGFPIEVTCDIEVISTYGDSIFAYEGGLPSYVGTINEGNNTAEETIIIQTRYGYIWNLGNKNRLSSVSYGGGDAGGGNVSCTYSYSNFNSLVITG